MLSRVFYKKRFYRRYRDFEYEFIARFMPKLLLSIYKFPTIFYTFSYLFPSVLLHFSTFLPFDNPIYLSFKVNMKATALQKRVRKSIDDLLERIREQQYYRADAIEAALKYYEKNVSLKARDVQDYVALIKAQRLLCGMENENTKLSGSLKIKWEG